MLPAGGRVSRRTRPVRAPTFRQRETVTVRARYDTDRMLQVARVRIAAAVGADSETHVKRLHTVDDMVAALHGSGLELCATHDCMDVTRPAGLAEA